jgi:methyl-accepting chemotaxis protein
MADLNVQTTQLIILAAVVLSMLVQAFVLLAAFMVARKTITKLQGDLDETRGKVSALIEKAQPVVERTREFLAKTTPKIETAVEDIVVVTQRLRAEAEDVQTAATELIERARRQGARMDSMMTRTLDTLDRAASFMTVTVSKPMRQLSAVLASAKAVVETLRTGPADGHIREDGHARAEHIKSEQDYYA